MWAHESPSLYVAETHEDDKEAAFKDKPEITLAKERNQTASKSPGEAQPESYEEL